MQFIIFLASSRKELSEITYMDIKGALRLDSSTALRLFVWLKQNLPNIALKRLRRIVFYSEKPSWWNYAHHFISRKKPIDFKRSDFVPPDLVCILSRKLNKLTSTDPPPVGKAVESLGKILERLAITGNPKGGAVSNPQKLQPG